MKSKNTEIDETKRINFLIKIFKEKDEDYIKDLLWELTYNPDELFKELKLENIDRNLFKNKLLEEYKKEYGNFHFGDEATSFETYGTDLQIKDPIIRDTIIEHCLEVGKDPNLLRSCIYNMCASKSQVSYEERRIEAFDILGFDKDEKTFIEQNTISYNIGELLKNIQKNLYPDYVPKQKKKNPGFKYNYKRERFEKNVVENKEIIKEFYKIVGVLSNKEKESLIDVLNKFRVAYLNPKDLLEKEDFVKNLISDN